MTTEVSLIDATQRWVNSLKIAAKRNKELKAITNKGKTTEGQNAYGKIDIADVATPCTVCGNGRYWKCRWEIVLWRCSHCFPIETSPPIIKKPIRVIRERRPLEKG